MEQIQKTHHALHKAWSLSRTQELAKLASYQKAAWAEIWAANGVAYQSVEGLAGQLHQLLVELFNEFDGPFREALDAGDSAAVDSFIDFLSVDVPAFRCGYAKEDGLRTLKSVPLSKTQQERLRNYGLGLCQMALHRREIGEAGRLMIHVADQCFVDQLRTFMASDHHHVAKKSAKMLRVVLNGRKDLY